MRPHAITHEAFGGGNRTALRRLLVEENDASAIEYTLLASCIAVVIATAVNTVGSNLRDNFYQKLADAMPG